jgi:branched-chain amino acid transport system substrate-binding protein
VSLAKLPVDDQSLFTCATRLACATLYGGFSVDPQTGRQRGHALLTAQWQNGRRVAVWPPELAQAPLRYPLGSSNATPQR